MLRAQKLIGIVAMMVAVVVACELSANAQRPRQTRIYGPGQVSAPTNRTVNVTVTLKWISGQQSGVLSNQKLTLLKQNLQTGQWQRDTLNHPNPKTTDRNGRATFTLQARERKSFKNYYRVVFDGAPGYNPTWTGITVIAR